MRRRGSAASVGSAASGEVELPAMGGADDEKARAAGEAAAAGGGGGGGGGDADRMSEGKPEKKAGEGEDEQDEEEDEKGQQVAKKPLMQRRGSTLELVREAGEESRWKLPDLHLAYNWLCLPYRDKWVPLPSKKTMRKMLNRLDFNSYNPFELFEEFYQPYSNLFGPLITLGCVTLLVIYSVFAFTTLSKDLRVQQDTFDALDGAAYPLPSKLGLQFFPAGSPEPDYNTQRIYFEASTCLQQRCETCQLKVNVTCTRVLMVPCVVADQLALCPEGPDLIMQNSPTSAEMRYVELKVRYCDGVLLGTCNSSATAGYLTGGTFALRMEWRPSPPVTTITDPSFNTTVRFPHHGAYMTQVDAVFERVIDEFPSRWLRETSFDEYTRLRHTETRYAEFTTDEIVFQVRARMHPTRQRSIFFAQTILDVASGVGGIFMICKIGLAVFSIYVVQKAFYSSRKMYVDTSVARLLLQKKREELDEYGKRLADMRAHEQMRISYSDMVEYLTYKRDRELTTYKTALALSLNTRHKRGVLSSEHRQDDAEERRRKRLDELQDLVRVDELQRNEQNHPDLPRLLNIFAMGEIRRQAEILNDFVQSLKEQ